MPECVVYTISHYLSSKVGWISSAHRKTRDWRGWVFRKPGRLERLRQVKRKYTTKAGNRTVRDLIAFAEGALQAVTWRDEFETVHLPVWKQSRTLTEDHKAKIAAGRKRAHKARQQAIEARLGVDFTRP